MGPELILESPSTEIHYEFLTLDGPMDPLQNFTRVLLIFKGEGVVSLMFWELSKTFSQNFLYNRSHTSYKNF